MSAADAQAPDGEGLSEMEMLRRQVKELKEKVDKTATDSELNPTEKRR